MELFKNFRFDVYYKPIVYVFGIILIISFFIEPIEIEISKLRQISLLSFFYGITVWLINELISLWESQKNELEQFKARAPKSLEELLKPFYERYKEDIAYYENLWLGTFKKVVIIHVLCFLVYLSLLLFLI